MELGVDPSLVVGFLLAMVRTSLWLSIAPPFGSSGIPVKVRLGVASTLSALVASDLQPADDQFGTGELISGVAYQAFIGVSLGFLVMMLFAAVQAAGELADVFAGFSSASLYDPFSNAAASPLGRFYHMLATGILFATGGHLMLTAGLLRSFDAAPLEGIPLDNMGAVLSENLPTFLLAAVQISFPLLAALAVTEILLGLLGRAAPQLNVFVLGFSLKSLVLLLLTGLCLPLLPLALDRLVDQSMQAGSTLLGM